LKLVLGEGEEIFNVGATEKILGVPVKSRRSCMGIDGALKIPDLIAEATST
jgi:hypothetical protein